MKLVSTLLLASVVVAAGPLLIIWSLNTLFPTLAIGYTIKTWSAAFIVAGILSAKGGA